MDYTKLDPHRVDHLVVLVGSNPLPNLVAIRLLLDPNGARQVSLVHTKQEHQEMREAGTKAVAENIRNTLVFSRTDAGYTDPFDAVLSSLSSPQERREKLDADHLEYVPFDDPSNSRNVAEAVLTCLNRHLPADRDRATGDLFGKTVGVHYSGGTKTMAAYAVTQALVALMGSTLPPASKPRLSHLDARKLRIVFDDPVNPLTKDPGSAAVGTTYVIPLADQISVHGWEVVGGYTAGTPWHSEIRPLNHTALLRAARVACNGFKATLKEWGAVRSDKYKTNQATLVRPMYGNVVNQEKRRAIDAVGAFHDALRDAFAPGQAEVNVEAAAKTAGLTRKDFQRWVEASWLETLALEAFLACQQACGLHDITMGLKCKPSGHNIDDFELDAVALRGYQLFVISCTTILWDKGDIKKKLFEVYHRARQIGGDEARVAVLCPYGNARTIENEMFHAHNLGQRVRVFGSNDLPNLNARVKEWIKEASA